jgi:hypothetical protein
MPGADYEAGASRNSSSNSQAFLAVFAFFRGHFSRAGAKELLPRKNARDAKNRMAFHLLVSAPKNPQ